MPVPQTKEGVALCGVGYTTLTRTPDRSEVALGVEACRMAAEDAGLDPSLIDGISIQVHHYPPPETEAIARGLNMREINWRRDGGLTGIGSVGMGAEAIESGRCKALVICKIMNTIAPVNTPLIDPQSGEVGGWSQFEAPYGLGYTMQRVGLYARRYMHRYGVTEEQIGWVALVEREHAIAHPYAFQKKPLSMGDYLASRWIAEPVRLMDCDIPINGAFAYLMVRGDIAKTLRRPPVWVAGWASSDDVLYHLEPLGHGIDPLATTLYRDTGLGPGDMDIAFPYDGFTFFVPMWLEHLGLVEAGAAGAFIEGGSRIRKDGQLPLNLHGGNLAGGRMHGHGHVTEAVEQLRGTAGDRQVTKRLNHAVVSGGFPTARHVGILSASR